MKSRTKKIIALLLLVLSLIYSINYTSNRSFNYAQNHNQSKKAQDIFWKYDVTKPKFRNTVGAYYENYVDGYNSFALSLNDQYEATYHSKLGKNPNPDVFNIIIYKKATDDDQSRQVTSMEVNRKDFSIVDLKDSDTVSNLSPETRKQIEERHDNTLSQEEVENLKNLAIQRFKEAQDKYYKAR